LPFVIHRGPSTDQDIKNSDETVWTPTGYGAFGKNWHFSVTGNRSIGPVILLQTINMTEVIKNAAGVAVASYSGTYTEVLGIVRQNIADITIMALGEDGGSLRDIWFDQEPDLNSTTPLLDEDVAAYDQGPSDISDTWFFTGLQNPVAGSYTETGEVRAYLLSPYVADQILEHTEPGATELSFGNWNAYPPSNNHPDWSGAGGFFSFNSGDPSSLLGTPLSSEKHTVRAEWTAASPTPTITEQ
jgi:hypothetical protein